MFTSFFSDERTFFTRQMLLFFINFRRFYTLLSKAHWKLGVLKKNCRRFDSTNGLRHDHEDPFFFVYNCIVLYTFFAKEQKNASIRHSDRLGKGKIGCAAPDWDGCWPERSFEGFGGLSDAAVRLFLLQIDPEDRDMTRSRLAHLVKKPSQSFSRRTGSALLAPGHR